MTVLLGDCVTVMAGMEPESVDAIVTDPPYGLEFMGKEWDKFGRDTGPGYQEKPRWTPDHMGKGFKSLPNHFQAGLPAQQFHAQWATAALRVAKPGAYLLAFGGTRTHHRLMVAIEDAGWEIRDTILWGSALGGWINAQGFPKSRSSLKPAWEPIVLARKPGPLRELDIDGCRLPTNGEPVATHHSTGRGVAMQGNADESWARPYQPGDSRVEVTSGRWPANVILTDPIFDGGWEGVVGGGTSKDGVAVRRNIPDGGTPSHIQFKPPTQRGEDVGYGGEGGMSRFFLVSKAPTRERIVNGERSPHPTQKPEALIRHLVKLVTPSGGTVLDPFLGSGTLGVVADGLGISWVGIEREPEYAAWAEKRIAAQKPEWAAA